MEINCPSLILPEEKCSAFCPDGACLIFNIVNIVTSLSKRSENEKEKEGNINTSMTLTSPKRAIKLC